MSDKLALDGENDACQVGAVFDAAPDILAGYLLGLTSWFVAAGPAYMFRAFRLVADA